MGQKNRNIFAFHEEMIKREGKEKLLNQKAVCVWMTGLSGSGKTTIATAAEKELHQAGFLTQLLDGDNIRDGINRDLGFSPEDRLENIRRIAEINKLFIHCGIITINCFVSPTELIRSQAKSIIGEENFLEVFIDTPLEICEARDVKGLYKKARAGAIPEFTGISSPFEKPKTPSLTLHTQDRSVDETVRELLDFLIPRIKLSE